MGGLIFFGIFVIATAAAMHTNIHPEFESYKSKYGKKYNDAVEEEMRKNIFLEKLEFVKKHNELYENGEVTYNVEINHLSDLRDEELNSCLLNIEPSTTPVGDFLPTVDNIELPSEVDWRTKGVVTRVKDQLRCGSCWAFSTTGALEGQWAIKHKELISLSEQNLIDCSPYGCDGGWMYETFQFIKKEGGIDTEESYPYTGDDHQHMSCLYNSTNSKVTVKDAFNNFPPGDEIALQKAVALIGPMSVGIDVSGPFGQYKGSVYYNPDCTKEIGHAVLVVGYGTDAETGMDYWLVKNSWGNSWGDKGYIKMARNKKNNCEIASVVSYPIV